ncbi:UNVERIFIED_CONTAM: F-box protein SKIP8 [Sesamum calycinum]|uniref:F-box protein SKIP8 n=1 Tax=Sesamum calycinum TaxID=2727403 RepID=A0AAW2LZ41_9LAMI
MHMTHNLRFSLLKESIARDFTLEQDNVTPPNGWKAYYAATRAIVTINAEFFRIVRERLLPAMVMESWQLAFSWENVADFQIRDVRTRVLTDLAWVTMKVFVDIGAGPFNVTNIFEFHNGRWYMVHHHSSALLIHRGGQQQLMQA